MLQQMNELADRLDTVTVANHSHTQGSRTGEARTIYIHDALLEYKAGLLAASTVTQEVWFQRNLLGSKTIRTRDTLNSSSKMSGH
jgi:hypothetical protein